MFIPFSRLDDSRTRASGGYGLGLSIVSRIAFWFNGSMKVDESRELGGARFVMTWPIKPLTQILAADELTQERSERDIDTKPKICLLYTSPSPRDGLLSRMPSSA